MQLSFNVLVGLSRLWSFSSSVPAAANQHSDREPIHAQSSFTSSSAVMYLTLERRWILIFPIWWSLFWSDDVQWIWERAGWFSRVETLKHTAHRLMCWRGRCTDGCWAPPSGLLCHYSIHDRWTHDQIIIIISFKKLWFIIY